jgi:UDP-N-acetyl-D-mannosaminuronate dehydrogenase
MATDDVVVAGLGEVGGPLFDLIRRKHSAVGIDIQPTPPIGKCAVLHICYPFDKAFVDSTLQYIRAHGPALTIINSTVAPGTTRAVHSLAGTPVAYSPIRGKHSRMKNDILHYTKFIGGIDHPSAVLAEKHFQGLGLKTKLLASPEAAELAKLTETTYFGVLIAWAQEVARYCDDLEIDYDEVVSFYDEISFLPSVKYTPGIIGGHCVMPNIAILKQRFTSDLLDAIVASNEMRIRQAEAESVVTRRKPWGFVA